MDAVFLKLLNLSLSASWLVAAVLLLRLLLKRAPKAIHCLLWAIVALRLVLPFSLESSFSLLPEKPAPAPESSVTQTTPEVLTGFEAVDQQINAFLAHRFQTSQTTPNPLPPVTDGGEVPVPAETGLSVMEIVTSVWVLGMVVMISYSLVAYLRLRYRVRDSVPLQDNIRISDKIPSPFILGIFRPRIYLPHNLSEGDRPFVLAHENAHLKRRDHWWKPLGFALLVVYWFNPVLWVAYVLLCRDIEFACDEKVLESLGSEAKRPYSRALVNSSVPRGLISACPLAFGEVGVKHRIKSVLNYKKPAFWIILVALLSCAVLAVCFLTDPRTPDSDLSAENPPATDTNTDTQTTNDTDDPDNTNPENTDIPDIGIDWISVSPIPSVEGGEALLDKYWILTFETIMGDYDSETGRLVPLSFRNAEKDLTAENLVLFFEFAINRLYGAEHYQTWYNADTKLYHIPVADIQEIVETYFGFDCTEKLKQLSAYDKSQTVLNDSLYDGEKNQIVLRHMGGFGGDGLFPVVAQVVKDGSTIGIVVDYYGYTYTSRILTRVYIVTDENPQDNRFQYNAVYEEVKESQSYANMSDEEVITSLLSNMVGALTADPSVIRIEDSCILETNRQRASVLVHTTKSGGQKGEVTDRFESGTNQRTAWFTQGGYYLQQGEHRYLNSETNAAGWWGVQGGFRMRLAQLRFEDINRLGDPVLTRNPDGTYTISASAQSLQDGRSSFAAAMLSMEDNVFISKVEGVSFTAEFDAKGNFVRYLATCKAYGQSIPGYWLMDATWGTCVSEVSMVTTDPSQIPDIVAPWGEFEGQGLPEPKKEFSGQDALELVKERGDFTRNYRLLSNETVPGIHHAEYLVLASDPQGSDVPPYLYEELDVKIYRVDIELKTVLPANILSQLQAAQRVEELFKDRPGEWVYECEDLRLSTENIPYHRILVRKNGFGANDVNSHRYFIVNAYTGNVTEIEMSDFY